MQITEDVQWHRGWPGNSGIAAPALRGLVPRPAQRCSVWVTEADYHEGAEQTLLWVPPHSEFNGWDAQPSEIALSLLVTARLTRTARGPSEQRIECTASIGSCVDLLEACAQPVPDMGADATLLADLNSPLFWSQVRWAGTAAAGTLTYLTVVAGEAGMELLLSRSAGRCTVHYAQLRVAVFGSAALGHWTLRDDVAGAVAEHLATATVLEDTSAPYLGMDSA